MFCHRASMKSHSILKNLSRTNCRTLINSKGKGLSLPCRHNTYQVKNAGDTGAGFSGKLLIGGSLLAAGAYMLWDNSSRLSFAAEVVAEEQPAVVIEAEQAEVKVEDEVPPAEEEEEAPVVVEEVPVLEFPSEVQYLLIGGGTATYSALRAIRKKDVTAQVLIVSEEGHTPYMRPPLSKELWFNNNEEDTSRLRFKQWNGKTKSLFYQKDGFYCAPEELASKTQGGVAFAGSTKVVALDPSTNVATLGTGQTVKYSKCLIATGGSPRNHSVIEGVEGLGDKTTLFRSADDFIKLNKLTDEVKSVTIVGGGFMGSELACALAHKARKTGMEVNQVFSHTGNMAHVLPEYLTKLTTGKVRDEGVNVITEAKVESAAVQDDGKVKLTLNDGKEVTTDHVIVASGLQIDTSLAESAGIEVDEKLGGYKVNAELQARSNIWVAGDASCFYDPKLGRRRVEHHDHAVVSGRLAGDNMTGGQKLYTHQSMFWSDLGPDVGYEAIGLVDSTLPTVGVFAKATEDDTPKAAAERALQEEQGVSPVDTAPKKLSEDFGKGVVFYLREKDEKVVGILLWNIFGRMPLARKIIRDQQSYDDYSELAKLFKIHNEDF